MTELCPDNIVRVSRLELNAEILRFGLIFRPWRVVLVLVSAIHIVISLVT